MKIIPIFIPHAGCPYKCVYCDQHAISGAVVMPSVEEIHSIIKRNLKSMSKNEKIGIGFFGGTFTSLPSEWQEKYLKAVRPYIKKRVHELRMSTHPEAVSEESIRRFKKHGGRLVELGIQSLDREVLKKIKRQVSFKVVKEANKIIKKSGLKTGVQIMVGLPGDNLERSKRTVKKLIQLRPETARIYPAIVLKGTELATRYRKGQYRPLSLEKAIEYSSLLSDMFEHSGVKVIRIGLHPSKDLDSGNTLLAGPYHHAFGEMVRSRQMRNKIISMVKEPHALNRSRIEVTAPKNRISLISGHKGTEKKFLERYFNAPLSLRISSREKKDIEIKDIRKNIVIIDSRMPFKAKEKLRRLNFHVEEAPLHKKLSSPIKGHVDMMLFRRGKKVIYEPSMEKAARLLRQNGYQCLKGERIASSVYPKDIIYNACSAGKRIVHYKGKVERNIKNFKARFLLCNQGYTKCSIIPVDAKRIITSDKGIKEVWESSGGEALLVTPGYVKLYEYKAGFIGGASGVNERCVFFVGRLDTHPDAMAIRDFIKPSGKGIIELYNGPLHDVGTVMFFEAG